MPSNIEIKARASDWKEQLAAGSALADSTETLLQTDTFFRCDNGRLKLREERGRGARLIFYRRADLKGGKVSDYALLPVKSPARVKTLFLRRLGAAGRVEKKRFLCLVGRTRVHFDEVKGLGRFIELEVVLRPGEKPAAGNREAAALMKKLRIRKKDLVSGAYADMIRDKAPIARKED